LCELGARDRLVAVADSKSGLPEAVSGLPRVGRSMGQPSAESILALNPDLVCCSASQAEPLARAGLRTFMVDANGLEGVLDLTLRLGKTIGKAAEAEALVAGFRRRMQVVAERVKGAPELLVYFEGQGKSRGQGTLTHDLITLAGGRNLAGEQLASGTGASYPLISTEVLIQRDPDIIILDGSEGDPLTVAKARPGWAKLKAVRTGRVYASNITYTDWTPQCIEGLEAFARMFHPERFT
jgi:iron complex transport system substrate-binding protein